MTNGVSDIPLATGAGKVTKAHALEAATFAVECAAVNPLALEYTASVTGPVSVLRDPKLIPVTRTAKPGAGVSVIWK